MSATAHLDHFYPLRGDDRLIILASKPAMEHVAGVLRTLAPSETREYTLTVIEDPNDGTPTFPHLRCTRTQEPLRCLVERDTVVIAGHARGLEYLATALEHRAREWFDGGHAHVFPGEIDRGDGLSNDEDDNLVSDDSEELVVGGHGYIDDKFFGLPPSDPR